MKLGIVGSRGFKDLSLVHKFLSLILEEMNKYERELVIVSGGAKGPDYEGEKFADKNGLKKIIHIPDWSKGKGAGIERNSDIIKDSDFVIAFWDFSSRGTLDSINKAKKQNKLLCVVGETGNIEFTELGKEILMFLQEKPYEEEPEIE